MHHPTDRITHTTACYTSCGALAGTKNSCHILLPLLNGFSGSATCTYVHLYLSYWKLDVILWLDLLKVWWSSDRSFMVDPLSYFSFQPWIHDWCNKGCGVYYPGCGMVHIKDPLLLIEKSSPCSGSSMFPLSLSEWSFTICLMPYNHK